MSAHKQRLTALCKCQKVPYRTYKMAAQAAGSIKNWHDGTAPLLYAYKCNFCKRFHLTKTRHTKES